MVFAMRAYAIFRDWAGMARLPNVPTVWSNVFTAWVLAMWFQMLESRWLGLAWVLLGATLIYAGGAIFCEVRDVEFDRKFRPERPLPAGRVSIRWAAIVSVVLCLTGAWLMQMDIGRSTRLTVSVVGLIGVVFSYAILHKYSPWLAVPLMASCRPLMVLVVLFRIRLRLEEGGDYLPRIGTSGGVYMVALGLYVASISWMALGEVKAWRRKAVGVMLAALPLLDAVILMWYYLVLVDSPVSLGMLWVPLGCMGLAIGLRKVAAAT